MSGSDGPSPPGVAYARTVRDLQRFGRIALACVHREYPHKLDHVAREPGDVRTPRDLHPAFFGAYDWHSAVHAHWTIARVHREHPAPELAAALDLTLTAENLAVEAAYLAAHPTFERMYGWAWLLALATELRGTRWAAALAPAVDAVIANLRAFLPKQRYPIRTGTHANTAFALGLALDHARAATDHALEALIAERALAYYAADVDAPALWEPGGDDFLSPILVEADLMRRIAPDFPAWLHRFTPTLPPGLSAPVQTTDRSDGKLAHLDGLNLSRAWCFASLASAFSDGDPRRAAFAHAHAQHAQAGLAAVGNGEYMGDHWLATFAMYLVDRERETAPVS